MDLFSLAKSLEWEVIQLKKGKTLVRYGNYLVSIAKKSHDEI